MITQPNISNMAEKLIIRATETLNLSDIYL